MSRAVIFLRMDAFYASGSSFGFSEVERKKETVPSFLPRQY